MGKNGNDKKENDVQRQVFDLVKSLASKDRILTIPQLFIECFGSLEAGLFMSQCLHWCDKGGRTDGFFFKSDKEWMEEIHISRNAIRSARSMLEKLGILETKVHRANGFPTVHYRVNQQVLTNCLIAKVAANASGGTNDCPPQDERLSPTEQTLTEMTTKMTTENKTLCPEGHNVSATAEYSESTPPKQEPLPLPPLGTDSETLNAAAISRRIEAGAKPKATAARRRNTSAVAFSTPGAAYMVELYAKEGAALHRSAPGKFPSLTAKERFEAAEAKLGLERFKQTLVTFFTKNPFPSVAQVVGYVVTAAANGNGKQEPPPPPVESLDQELYAQVIKSLRFNPTATPEHGRLVAEITAACMRGGYDKEEVRAGGHFWWKDDWRGLKGLPPSASQFISWLQVRRGP